MKAWQIQEYGSPEGLRLVDLSEPEALTPDAVLVRVKAVSLNYRDLTALRAPRPGNLSPLIPCSDGAGEVIAVGSAVTSVKPGDRVAGCFFQNWPSGNMSAEVMASALGGPRHGMLTEVAVLREAGVVKVPDQLSYAEAATLPCAALTAWHALVEKGCVCAGQTILLLGTGGVSIFALQLARLHGARVCITSSSDAKLARACDMGAEATINYRTTPDWERAVWEWTGKQGVDHIIELGGAGTLDKSLAAVGYGGRISLIGVLTGFQGAANPWPIIARSVTVQGIYVGSRDMFQRLLAAVEASSLRPVIDRTFSFDEAPAAFAHLQSGAHFGKVVIAWE